MSFSIFFSLAAFQANEMRNLNDIFHEVMFLLTKQSKIASVISKTK